jgi:hypothetical protein
LVANHVLCPIGYVVGFAASRELPVVAKIAVESRA